MDRAWQVDHLLTFAEQQFEVPAEGPSEGCVWYQAKPAVLRDRDTQMGPEDGRASARKYLPPASTQPPRSPRCGAQPRLRPDYRASPPISGLRSHPRSDAGRSGPVQDREPHPR